VAVLFRAHDSADFFIPITLKRAAGGDMPTRNPISLRTSLIAIAAVLSLQVLAGTVTAQSLPAGAVRFVTAPDSGSNQARYRVREQLAGVDFPSDAIGKTTKVAGQIVFDANGAVLKEHSKFTVNVAALASDRDRRDNFIRRNSLQTEQFPNVTFVPVAVTGLKSPLPDSGDVAFRMTGDLTVRDQTRLVTWNVLAKIKQGAVTGSAVTMFTFAEFGMTKPRVQSVLTVNDEITLELDFRLLPQK
jgi:polyisoprenoid-binding protein YceI